MDPNKEHPCPLNVWGRLMRAAESSDFVKSLSDFV